MIEGNVGFIGAGRMAEALGTGMLAAGVTVPAHLFASDPSEERRRRFADVVSPNVFAGNLALVRACRNVVLSVKPCVVPAVAQEIRDALTADHLLVSIAAGVTLTALCKATGTGRLVRVMPNTPARVRAGAAAYCPGPAATPADCRLVEEMLGAVGLCVRVTEDQMDAVTGLSGSGPAYLYLVVEAMARGGVRGGLPADMAVRLAAQTALGAARMVLETGTDPAALRDQVTTPGGTTVEGLRVLDRAGMAGAFADAVLAATDRSRQLSAAQA